MSNFSFRWARLLVLALLLSTSAHAQFPTAFSIEKIFSYHQTDANTLADYQPAVALTVTFLGQVSSATQVELRGGPAPFVFSRETTADASNSTFTCKRTFASHAELNAALPSITYNLATSGNGTTYNVPVTLNFVTSISAPRFTNFDNLQVWDGSATSAFWSSPPANSLPFAATFTVVRADDVILFSADSLSQVNNLSPLATAVGFSFIASSPGQALAISLVQSRVGGITSTNSSVALSSALKVSVRAPLKRPPVIDAQPVSTTVREGSSTFFYVGATNVQPTYVWRKDGTVISTSDPAFVTTGPTLLLRAARRTDAGSYTVTITCPGGSVTSSTVTLTVTPNTVAPLIDQWPLTPPAVVVGAPVTVPVRILSPTPITVQWYRDGNLLNTQSLSPSLGIVRADLVFSPFRATDVGAYSLVVLNSAGADSRDNLVLAPTPASRISNLSVLTSLTSPTDTFTVGYVLGGAYTSGSKRLVLRAVGPALSALGVGGTLDDPKLETYAGSAKTGENDDWAGAPSLGALFSSVGAFPFASATSRDAALSALVATRDNSVRISAANGSSGLVLAEVYDATPSADFVSTTPRLLNVSVLKSLGTGLTVGFTISGTAPRSILIRAIGPTLGTPPFNVAGAVSDPQLTLFDGNSVKLAENDNWGGTPALTSAFATVGAFALPSTSKDAALLTTLTPGGYSVQVIGLLAATGVALVEVYELP